jgi:hypothetical protein
MLRQAIALEQVREQSSEQIIGYAPRGLERAL